MFEFLWRARLKDLEKEEGFPPSETGELFEFVEMKGPGHPDSAKDRAQEAPRGRGATAPPTTEARPAETPRGGRRVRQRGDAGGRRPRD
jgi:hypothetical protein